MTQRRRSTDPRSENGVELLIKFNDALERRERMLKIIEMVENAARSVFFDPSAYTAKHIQAFA
jgi:hypothetical protein